MTKKKQKPTTGRPKGDPTTVVKIPAAKITQVTKLIGHSVALRQAARMNVTLTVDEAVVASKAIGRKLTAKPFVMVRVPTKDVDKIKQAMQK